MGKIIKIERVVGGSETCRKCGIGVTISAAMIKTRKYWCESCRSAVYSKHNRLKPKPRIPGVVFSHQAIISAYKNGFSVVDGVLLKDGYPYKTRVNIGNYLTFSYFYPEAGRSYTVMVHRLIAYQKYKEKMFEKGIQCRHFDGNSHNNFDDNILIGTALDNAMDKPPEVRKRAAAIATSYIGAYDYDEVYGLWISGKSKSEIMAITGIKTRNTVSAIINKKTDNNNTAFAK